MIPLRHFETFLRSLIAIDALVKSPDFPTVTL
jgi:hypothetical protein